MGLVPAQDKIYKDSYGLSRMLLGASSTDSPSTSPEDLAEGINKYDRTPGRTEGTYPFRYLSSSACRVG
jgi:hypothetical protein